MNGLPRCRVCGEWLRPGEARCHPAQMTIRVRTITLTPRGRLMVALERIRQQQERA